MVLYDGSVRGGSRGGYWTGARKAFEFAVIGRFKPGNHTLREGLSRQGRHAGGGLRQQAVGRELRVRDRRGHDAGSRVHEVVCRGAKTKRRSGMDSTSSTFAPTRHRSRASKTALVRGPVREGRQRRCARLDGLERTGRLAVQPRPGNPGSPTATPFFEGDDPGDGQRTKPSTDCSPASTTGARGGRAKSRASISSLTRTSSRTSCAFSVTPIDAISTGLILYDFQLDKPASLGPQVTSDDVAYELDWYMEWSSQRLCQPQFRGWRTRTPAKPSSSRRGARILSFTA